MMALDTFFNITGGHSDHLLVALIIGLVPLLFGYRLFRFCVFLAGFAIVTFVLNLFTDRTVALFWGVIAGILCSVFGI
ncbi:MAG: hypothetical protein IJR99_17545 [Kiritimatiellae bacterium]|nr:hypothetical protein [Kiritimatiellia bacterium]